MNDILDDYINRCLLLGVPIIIDGVECKYEKGQLVGVRIVDMDVENFTYVFPDCITGLHFVGEDYYHFVYLCNHNKISTINFNNVVSLELTDVSILKFMSSCFVDYVIANNWYKVYALPYIIVTEGLEVNSVLDFVLQDTYNNIKYLYARSASNVLLHKLLSIEECYFDSAKNIMARSIEDSRYLTVFYAPKVSSMIGDMKCCINLKDINMSSMSSVPARFLSGCHSLKSVCFDSATNIGTDAFNDCHSLESVELPNVVTLGNFAFHNCDNLERVVLPKLKYLSSLQFRHCFKLREIVVSKDTKMDCKSSSINFSFRVKIIRK